VESVGSNVQRFRVGDEVYFCCGGLGATLGNYAEMAVVDERLSPVNLRRCPSLKRRRPL
jgi:NADPH:quinone reductase-like Zn-dependent oxidoreductase